MRVAGLDLGTNTCLCLIAEIEVQSVRVVSDEVEIVRLGQGVGEAGRFHPDALVRIDATLARFAKSIAQWRPSRVLACATSAARDASDRQQLIDIGRKHGIPIEVISGEKEAELTFRGTVDPSETEPLAIVDVGGGSTEVMLGDGGQLRSRVSLDVGSVRLTERWIKEADPLAGMRRDVFEAIIRSGYFSSSFGARKVIAVAGTPTTLAAIDLGLKSFDSKQVEGHRFTLASIESWIQRLNGMSVEQRRVLTGMEPKRADVIVGGLVCLSESLRALGHSSLVVSTRGLRFGVAQWLAERS